MKPEEFKVGMEVISKSKNYNKEFNVIQKITEIESRGFDHMITTTVTSFGDKSEYANDLILHKTEISNYSIWN